MQVNDRNAPNKTIGLIFIIQVLFKMADEFLFGPVYLLEIFHAAAIRGFGGIVQELK